MDYGYLMPAGRPPKPTAIKAAEGNPGKRPLNKAELLEPSETPKCPSHLSAGAKKEWRRLASILGRRRLLRLEDQIMLANLCSAIAVLTEARAEFHALPVGERLTVRTGGAKIVEVLDKKGNVKSRTITGGTMMVNPLLYVIRDQVNTITRIGTEFGISPSARARLTYTNDMLDIPASDPLESLLAGSTEDDAGDPVVIQ